MESQKKPQVATKRTISRISATGYCIKYPAEEALGQPAVWYACSRNGVLSKRGYVALNGPACEQLLKEGRLKEVDDSVALASGVVIFEFKKGEQ